MLNKEVLRVSISSKFIKNSPRFKFSCKTVLAPPAPPWIYSTKMADLLPIHQIGGAPQWVLHQIQVWWSLTKLPTMSWITQKKKQFVLFFPVFFPVVLFFSVFFPIAPHHCPRPHPRLAATPRPAGHAHPQSRAWPRVPAVATSSALVEDARGRTKKKTPCFFFAFFIMPLTRGV